MSTLLSKADFVSLVHTTFGAKGRSKAPIVCKSERSLLNKAFNRALKKDAQDYTPYALWILGAFGKHAEGGCPDCLLTKRVVTLAKGLIANCPDWETKFVKAERVEQPELPKRCSRCQGTGVFESFKHVKGGRCFRCDGSGKEPGFYGKGKTAKSPEF